jgi:glutathione S-transferase
MEGRPDYPAIAAWMARLEARPAARPWLPDNTA